jgi:MSHA biogenesis protein MshL
MIAALKSTTAVLAVGIVCAGCATAERFAVDAKARIERTTGELQSQRVAPVAVRSVDGNHVSAVPVEYTPPARGVVTLQAADLPLSAAITGVAQSAGLSVSYQQGVDPHKPVSVDLRDVDYGAAIREIAYAAGFIAVFDRPSAVTIAREATLTFRVPARVLKTLQSRYAVSNAAQAASGPPGMAPLAAATNAPAAGTSSTTISVSGSSLHDASALKSFLSAMSGAEPTLLAEEGIISARGNSAQLRRLSAFLDHFVRESLAQVEVELSVVEVTLASEFSTGIDWKRVIPAESAFGAALGTLSLQSSRELTGGFSVQSTSRSIESVVRALEQFTTIHELTRPRVVAMNHAHTVYRASVQRPYLPTASSNVTTGGASTTVQSSASVSYSEDGITFGVQAHVIDPHRVELTIVPALTATQRIDTFQISRDVTLSAPVQPRQDAHLQVLAEHGKTMVIGGLRASSGVDRVSGVPGAVRVPGLNLLLGGHADSASAREIVILLHARIVAAPRVSTLIGESV